MGQTLCFQDACERLVPLLDDSWWVESKGECSALKQLLFACLVSPEVLDAGDGQQLIVQNHASLVKCSTIDIVAFLVSL
jgi:hypothetical protein